MNIKAEGILLSISLIISALAAIWIYLIGFDSLPNPDLMEYIATAMLYIFGLISIRGIWKLTLEQKITSKKD